MMRYFDDGIHFITLGERGNMDDMITQIGCVLEMSGIND